MWTLEINDVDLRVWRDNELVHSTPGVAYVEKNATTFGEQALRQLKADPAACQAQYWQQLDQSGVSTRRREIQTQADLIFQQLLEIKRAALLPSDEEIWIVVPSDTDANQISLLFGICMQAKLRVADFVDASAAAVALPTVGDFSFVDLGLHRTTITRLHSGADSVEVVDQTPIRSCGLLAYTDAWIAAISRQSLQESRFDPRKFGPTEQQVFDALLAQELDLDEITIAIEHRRQARDITIKCQDLIAASARLFDRTAQQIGKSADVAVTHRVGRLPGFTQHLINAGHSVHSVAPDALQDVLREQPLDSSRPADAREFRSGFVRVASSVRPKSIQTQDAQRPLPTHLLNGDAAHPLGAELSLGSSDVKLVFVHDHYELQGDAARGTLLNRSVVTQPSEVRVGDRIAHAGIEYRLIAVVDG